MNQENNITIEVHACGASEIIEEFSKSEVFQDYNITWKAPDSTIGVRNNGELFLHPIKYYMRNKNGNLIDTGKSRAGHWRTYKYSGKELDRMHGLDMFDHGATAATDEITPHTNSSLTRGVFYNREAPSDSLQVRVES